MPVGLKGEGERMSEENTLAEALVEMQSEYETIKKNKKVSIKTRDKGSFSYNYADLASILECIRPLMKKHGFALLNEVTADLDLKVCLLHKSGEERFSLFPLHKTSDPKALGSEITYMRRYGAVCLLGLATEDDDDGQIAAGDAKRRKETGEDADARPRKARKQPEMETKSSTGKVQQLWIQARKTADAVSKATGEDWNPEEWLRSNTECESTKELTTPQVNDLVAKLKKIEADNTPPS